MVKKQVRKNRAKPTDNINYWSEASGGVRGSRLLWFGALALCLAAVLNGIGTLLASVQPDLMVRTLKVAWLVWIGALWLVGAGFIWTGLNPVMTRIGLAPGLLHVFQGLFLLLALFGDIRLPIPNTALSSGRLLLIILFAFVERPNLTGRDFGFLVAAAGMIQLKLLLRVMTPLGQLPEPWPTLMDAGMLFLLGLALLRVCRTIRRHENAWAKEQYQTRAAGFSAFNNPQHPWNQD